MYEQAAQIKPTFICNEICQAFKMRLTGILTHRILFNMLVVNFRCKNVPIRVSLSDESSEAIYQSWVFPKSDLLELFAYNVLSHLNIQAFF